jgi:hypothetical protein
MHGACFDFPLQKWFDFKTPKTTVPPNYIIQAIEDEIPETVKPSTKLVWLGVPPKAEYFTKSKKGSQWEMCSLIFQSKTDTLEIKVNKDNGDWLIDILSILSINNQKQFTLQEVKENYEALGLDDFELFWDNKPVNGLFKMGLLHL